MPIVMTITASLHGLVFGRMGAEWVRPGPEYCGGCDFSGEHLDAVFAQRDGGVEPSLYQEWAARRR
jgi:hypothetical protein